MAFVLESERPIAVDSLDHLHPFGTIRDNSTNARFNAKLYALFPPRPLAILDLGCAGGGFVGECVQDGHRAVGLEGSDAPKRLGRGEWGRIPEHLFTCDVTARFVLRDRADGEPALFDVITAWELVEHIPRERLPGLFENVRRHLAPGGLFIVSTTSQPSVFEDHDLHVTREGRTWWIDRLREAGLSYRADYVRYFATQFVRGDFELGTSFHLVCSNRPDLPPPASWAQRLSDLRYEVGALERRAEYLLRASKGEVVPNGTMSRGLELWRVRELLRFYSNVATVHLIGRGR
jgi:SAM-dependent methyltransferase